MENLTLPTFTLCIHYSFGLGVFGNGRGQDSCRVDFFAVPEGSESGNPHAHQRWCGQSFGHEAPNANYANQDIDKAVISYLTPFR